MINEINLLQRISRADWDLYSIFRRTKKNKLIIDMDSLEALFDCQSESDKENMPTISKLIGLYNSYPQKYNNTIIDNHGFTDLDIFEIVENGGIAEHTQQNQVYILNKYKELTNKK